MPPGRKDRFRKRQRSLNMCKRRMETLTAPKKRETSYGQIYMYRNVASSSYRFDLQTVPLCDSSCTTWQTDRNHGGHCPSSCCLTRPCGVAQHPMLQAAKRVRILSTRSVYSELATRRLKRIRSSRILILRHYAIVTEMRFKQVHYGFSRVSKRDSIVQQRKPEVIIALANLHEDIGVMFPVRILDDCLICCSQRTSRCSHLQVRDLDGTARLFANRLPMACIMALEFLACRLPKSCIEQMYSQGLL